MGAGVEVRGVDGCDFGALHDLSSAGVGDDVLFLLVMHYHSLSTVIML